MPSQNLNSIHQPDSWLDVCLTHPHDTLFIPSPRSMDVESGPDADTPRPIGVGLLLCMLERGGDDVVMALLQLAQKTQVTRQRGNKGEGRCGVKVAPSSDRDDPRFSPPFPSLSHRL